MKVHRLDAMTRGWFVGNFVPTSLRTGACEVSCRTYKKGEAEARHVHKVAVEVTLIASGRVRMEGRELGAGDIVVIDPGEPTDFQALEDTLTVVVKVPSVIGDKYPA